MSLFYSFVCWLSPFDLSIFQLFDLSISFDLSIFQSFGQSFSSPIFNFDFWTFDLSILEPFDPLIFRSLDCLIMRPFDPFIVDPWLICLWSFIFPSHFHIFTFFVFSLLFLFSLIFTIDFLFSTEPYLFSLLRSKLKMFPKFLPSKRTNGEDEQDRKNGQG
jgi:hypothetical protein